MAYPQIVAYLESFINYEKIPAYPYKESLKLERIRDFLASINNPQDSLSCIHIAGTKGKGSTCAFVAYILREAGYKVGLYTSPHLSDFRERIRILVQSTEYRVQRNDFEGMITKDELVDLVVRLRPAIDKYNQNSKYGPLSFFEVYTALAFVYFKENKVDFAVLETGLGGRLDATNVVEPLVAAITPISYEHTQKLGNTLREIAAEKAGIIKAQSLKLKVQSSVVITAPQEREALEVIRKKCNEAGAKLYEVGKDLKYQKKKNSFSIKGLLNEYKDLKIGLIGEHQFINATAAVGIIEVLKPRNNSVDAAAIRRGFLNTLWPGRCEVAKKSPLVILDGAQNIASARVLKIAIKEKFQYKNLFLVLGISKDKDLKGICSELCDLADEVILTQANNPRAVPPEILSGYFNGKKTHITKNVKEAKNKAVLLAADKDLVLVTGSLFVVGEFRDAKS